MPVYNAERFLREAVDSILSQTLGDFEFICIDDGSTDNSPAILADFHDPRMKVVRQANLGVAEALNNGLQRAAGDYIARMDSDDVSAPERFEKQTGFLEKNPDIAIVGSFALLINEKGEKSQTVKTAVSPAGIRRALALGCPMIHPTVMFRGEIVGTIGFYPPTPHAEDYAWWLRAAPQFQMANIPEALILYRMHEGNVSAEYRKIQIASTKQVRREYWASRPPEVPDRRRWEADYRRLVRDEINLQIGAVVEGEIISKLETARIMEADLAFSAGRDDIGLRCLAELATLDQRKIWKTISFLAKAMGFHKTWAIVRYLFRVKFGKAAEDPLFNWQ